MSDLDKMMAFGNWLTSRKAQLTMELYSLSLNTKLPIGTIRIKAGHLEATQHVLDAFKDLYNGDLNKFMEEYLGQAPEEEDKESTDGQSDGTTA
jgi:hypothetical protein